MAVQFSWTVPSVSVSLVTISSVADSGPGTEMCTVLPGKVAGSVAVMNGD
jgi:hypothetical protein